MKKLDVSNARIPGTNVQGWRAVAVFVLGLYVLLFLILNDRKLEVDFVFFTFKSNMLLALVLIVVLGFVAGFVVGRRQPQHVEPPAELPPTAPPAPEE